MKLYTKEELIEMIREVSARGWHSSVKNTIDTRNDGAVGNTLEVLLGLEENNLPIPNMQEWELKGQTTCLWNAQKRFNYPFQVKSQKDRLSI